MRLLFFGDMDSTGFGTVTTDLGRALLNLGIDVRFVSQNKFGELPEPFASRTFSLTSLTFEPDAENPDGAIQGMLQYIPHLLRGQAAHLNLSTGAPWGDWKPDAVFLLGDFYGMRFMVSPHMEAFGELPVWHYAPIEGHDLPPLWNDIWKIIKPIAMSKFGQQEIAKVTGSVPPLMYHGVDSETFRPVTPSNPLVLHHGQVVLASKERCKAFFRINPRMRLILRTDRNMPRKGYSTLLRSMEPVLRAHPDVVLGLHCQSIDQGGFLWDSISKLPPDIGQRVMVPDWGPLPREALVALYNAADLYVSTSAEGFGLTIGEAAACGVPSVGLDYSAVPEVIGPAGKTVPVGRLLDNEYAHHWALPDEAAFTEAVNWMLDHPTRAREMGAAGPRHVAQTFQWSEAAQVLAGLLMPHAEPVRSVSDERVMVAA